MGGGAAAEKVQIGVKLGESGGFGCFVEEKDSHICPVAHDNSFARTLNTAKEFLRMKLQRFMILYIETYLKFSIKLFELIYSIKFIEVKPNKIIFIFKL